MSTEGKDRLTVEDVRKHKDFQHRTDEEINAIIDTVEKLSLLLYKRTVRKQNSQTDHDQKINPP
jgi:hypothetical protein